MKEMLRTARQNRYAVGAFNVFDFSSMKAAVDAAVELNSPIIIQISVKTIVFWGYRPIIEWFHNLAASAPIPTALHLDHCKDLEVINNCIKHGWTSVMIDASSFPFNENLAMTREVVAMAAPSNVSVEAEMGSIMGAEDDVQVEKQDAFLANPEEAVRFTQGVTLDCFAPAIGTVHGMYKGTPRIDFERLDRISRDTGLPLALHGGTGLPDEVVRKCIRLGCAKVNISTQLKHLFMDCFVTYYENNRSEYNPLKAFHAQIEEMKALFRSYIILFGSEGKA